MTAMPIYVTTVDSAGLLDIRHGQRLALPGVARGQAVRLAAQLLAAYEKPALTTLLMAARVALEDADQDSTGLNAADLESAFRLVGELERLAETAFTPTRGDG